MTQLEMDKENALMNEKHAVIVKLTKHLNDAQFDRKTLTSVMLRELKYKINEMLKNDF